MDLISPKFRTREGEEREEETSPQSAVSLVSSWSQLDSGTNSRLEELCLPDCLPDSEDLLPCQGDSQANQLETTRVQDLETSEETREINLQNNCDNEELEEEVDVDENDENIANDEEKNDVCDKENLTPEENEETEVKTGKKKNKKRRKHAKKKPQTPLVVEAEADTWHTNKKHGIKCRASKALRYVRNHFNRIF